MIIYFLGGIYGKQRVENSNTVKRLQFVAIMSTNDAQKYLGEMMVRFCNSIRAQLQYNNVTIGITINVPYLKVAVSL